MAGFLEAYLVSDWLGGHEPYIVDGQQFYVTKGGITREL